MQIGFEFYKATWNEKILASRIIYKPVTVTTFRPHEDYDFCGVFSLVKGIFKNNFD